MGAIARREGKRQSVLDCTVAAVWHLGKDRKRKGARKTITFQWSTVKRELKLPVSLCSGSSAALL